ncbi:hypothetical protein H4R21_002770 [Coemansia helicoidea]|uniref:Uncharacterized protein n=1 Tax=Coemansia helicoidea TaxID=1286919 RepID=A0ACC1L5R1_9FUNG|nr:hypothetical protein H4R21_002770 [Coemansia helicoidea]
MVIGDDFLWASRQDGIIVDKTLVCKALLESPDKAVRICLPRCFGKTFNLSIIAQFFNPVTVNYRFGDTGKPDLDVARKQRRQLFCGSLLEQHHPDFVEKHFASTPVIHIDFKAATVWVKVYAAPELLKDCARAKYKALEDAYSRAGTCLRGKIYSNCSGCGILAYRLFKELSRFLVAQHGGKYIILVDEYDQPLEAALWKEWQADADNAYLGFLKKMFKDNDDLAKGLLVGDHEFKLSDRGSDQRIAKELSLTTGRYRGGDAKTADTGDEGPGPLAALFAFTKEDVTELTRRTRQVSKRACSHSQEDIMDIIESWYGGYDFGFPTKRYNPWSVLKFLRRLIGRSTCPSGRTDLSSTDEVVTHLLHLGYLTMSPGNGVRIPNREARGVWNKSNYYTVFDNEFDDEFDDECDDEYDD